MICGMVNRFDSGFCFGWSIFGVGDGLIGEAGSSSESSWRQPFAGVRGISCLGFLTCKSCGHSDCSFLFTASSNRCLLCRSNSLRRQESNNCRIIQLRKILSVVNYNLVCIRISTVDCIPGCPQFVDARFRSVTFSPVIEILQVRKEFVVKRPDQPGIG